MSNFEDYFYQNIGKKIKQYRIAHGLKQYELSLLLSENEKYIGHIERGERHVSNKTLIKIMDMWHIQPSSFYKFDKEYTEWE